MGKNKLEVDGETLNKIQSTLHSFKSLDTTNIPSNLGNTNLPKIAEYKEAIQEYNKLQSELLNKIQEFPEMLYNVNDGFVQYDLQLKDSIDK